MDENLPDLERTLNIHHKKIVEAPNEVPESSLDYITDFILATPLSKGSIKPSSPDYKLIREVVLFEIEKMGKKSRKIGGLYSLHTTMVAHNGANLDLRNKSRSPIIDAGFINGLKLHDLPEELLRADGSATEEQRTELIEALEKEFLSRDRVQKLSLSTTRVNKFIDGMNLAQRITPLDSLDYFPIVDEAGRLTTQFDPRVHLMKLLDRNHNMRTLDAVRTFRESLDQNSMVIYGDNEITYPIEERLTQCVKAVYLLHRANLTIAKLEGKNQKHVKNALLSVYGGVYPDDIEPFDPYGTTQRKLDQLITDGKLLQTTPVKRLSQVQGLFGSTYIELKRIRQTLRNHYQSLAPDFEAIDKRIAQYPKAKLASITEGDPNDTYLDGNTQIWVQYIASRRTRHNIQVTDPLFQNASAELRIRMLEELLIDPSSGKKIRGYDKVTFAKIAQG